MAIYVFRPVGRFSTINLSNKIFQNITKNSLILLTCPQGYVINKILLTRAIFHISLDELHTEEKYPSLSTFHYQLSTY